MSRMMLKSIVATSYCCIMYKPNCISTVDIIVANDLNRLMVHLQFITRVCHWLMIKWTKVELLSASHVPCSRSDALIRRDVDFRLRPHAPRDVVIVRPLSAWRLVSETESTGIQGRVSNRHASSISLQVSVGRRA